MGPEVSIDDVSSLETLQETQMSSWVTIARPAVEDGKGTSVNHQETPLDLIRWKSVQQERRLRVHRKCQVLNLKRGMLTQHETPASHILVNDKYKLMYCFIPKVSDKMGDTL